MATPFTHAPGAVWRLAGTLLLVIGVFVVTMAISQPLNQALAAVDPASAHGAEVWADYLRRWTAWNHVRTITATGSLLCLILSVR